MLYFAGKRQDEYEKQGFMKRGANVSPLFFEGNTELMANTRFNSCLHTHKTAGVFIYYIVWKTNPASQKATFFNF